MKIKKKELVWIIIVGVLGMVYILGNTFCVSFADKNIMDFLMTTLFVPVIVLLVCGAILGRRNTLVQSLPYLLVLTTLIFGGSMIGMVHMYHNGYILEMLNNTKTSGNIVLNINDSITFGTVVQQGLICLVCACIGNGIGSKTVGALSKIRN